VLGREDLWVSIDRYGIMRPTKKVPKCPLPKNKFRTDVIVPEEMGEVELEDHDDWRTAEVCFFRIFFLFFVTVDLEMVALGFKPLAFFFK